MRLWKWQIQAAKYFSDHWIIYTYAQRYICKEHVSATTIKVTYERVRKCYHDKNSYARVGNLHAIYQLSLHLSIYLFIYLIFFTDYWNSPWFFLSKMYYFSWLRFWITLHPSNPFYLHYIDYHDLGTKLKGESLYETLIFTYLQIKLLTYQIINIVISKF